MDPQFIRNFCIIAHIDHGKSTLADRLLQATGTIEPGKMVEQVLDAMDLERERGITIKAQAVRLGYRSASGQEYQLNLIDTPGHVDFTYEVSRSLAACEGALLVVDAAQGIQAQTLANVYLTIDHDLALVPVVNKIDLEVAEPERVAGEIQQAFGFRADEIIFASGKEGTGVDEILEAIVDRIPSPKGRRSGPLRALIFDSKYDSYKGVVAYARVVDGAATGGSRLKMMSTGAEGEAMEVGVFRPHPTRVEHLEAGEVGYIATGLKAVGDAPVGDTITLAQNGAPTPLDSYKPMKPMVFAGLYPADGEDYIALKEALEKFRLNDAALTFQPESSAALGSGFRCGFLGLLHMDVVQERLEREYDLKLLATSPSVSYRAVLTDGGVEEVENPSKLPPSQRIAEIQEPWLDLTVLTPATFIGPIMDLVTNRRGEFKKMEYIQLDDASDGKETAQEDTPKAETRADATSTDSRVLLEYRVPLSEVLVDFYDQLKARTQGYASMDYSVSDYRSDRLVRLDVLVNGQPVDALSVIVHRDGAYQRGRELVAKLRELIPRQLFEVAIQGGYKQSRGRQGERQGAPQERAGQVLRRRRYTQAKAAGEAGGGQEAHEEARADRDTA